MAQALASWTRRRALTGLTGLTGLAGSTTVAGLALAGCSHGPPAGEDERILELPSGRALARAELLARVRQADHVLLGELHDNPHHHRRRGELLAQLAPPTVVVSEHLERGRRIEGGADLLARLQAAGFDASGWQWPVHRPLYAAALAAGLEVQGGNAARVLVQQVARQGLAVAPAEWRALLAAVPLPATAAAALERALVEGHCGHLGPERLPGLRDAQRVRDASLALALQAARGRPAVLLAGNGHVRADYGVPRLLQHLQPAAGVLAVGFGELGWRLDDAPYGVLWLTPGVERRDPCAAFPRPEPRPGAAAAASRLPPGRLPQRTV